ncbi:ATP-binding protein [Bdellovibrio sp. SKB1291214]|uniref:ATP-binding protein n=1 Tax=Bdellovibrio sp. SKB1291214 TaxID=1732569 RepID=UPI0015956F4D|nr:ATP-binding protein [Bdellovibrio sp. SKB1291214]UYL09926.1 ATP-binding protein [Bdellovibrio sp. SKB1291214]
MNLAALYINPYMSNEAFSKSQLALQRNLVNVSDLVQDNKIQSRRAQKVSTLVSAKIDVWTSYATNLRNRSKSISIDQFRSMLSAVNTDEINRTVLEMETEEQSLLNRRTARVDKDFQRTTWIVIFCITIAFLLFFLSTRILHKQIRLRQKVEKALDEARIKAMEASNLKSSFLANMSHEIRTPLNGIIGMTKLMEQTPLNARQLDYLETIKVSSTSLLSLINEILDLSKIESGKFQLEETNFELSSLIKSAVSIVDYSAKLKNLEIKTEIDPAVPEFLTGDPLRLRQVLLNLINNAIKFSEHGLIKVRITPKGPDANGSLHLLFEIIDQGIGFDAETKNKLFQSFSQGDGSMTRKYGGTGLGLAISKQIVEMMKGTIDVDSVKGIGSRFYFDVNLGLPHTDAEIQRISNLKPVAPLQGHVLIAEDNLVNQKVVSEMLSTMGCTSHVVENGNAAIAALLTDHYDLILMDAQMPVMDGYEATRLIRKGQAGEDNKTIPILATTANAIKGDIELCLEAGMNDYISKPISYNDLAFKIGKWMGRGHHVVNPLNMDNLKQEDKRSGNMLLKEVVEIFNEESPAQIKKMREAIASKEYAKIPPIAHNLKSSAAVLGAMRLKELAERIENLDLKSTNEQQVTLLVDSLDKELSLVQEYLGKHIRKQYPPPPEASP